MFDIVGWIVVCVGSVALMSAMLGYPNRIMKIKETTLDDGSDGYELFVHWTPLSKIEVHKVPQNFRMPILRRFKPPVPGR